MPCNHKCKYSVNSRDRHLTNYLIALLLLSFYYLAYRYPFEISSSTTSPGYSDTPFVLQISKYILFLSIVFFSFIILALSPSVKLAKISYLILAFYVGIFYLFMTGTFYAGITRNSTYAEMIIFWLAILPFLLSNSYGSISIHLTPISRVLLIFVYVSLLYFIVQVLLFIFFGRLPALSYAGSIVVRFGGIWDDPNGLAIMYSFTIPFIYFSKIGNIKKYSIIFLSVIGLLGTQSLTGVIAFSAGLALSTSLLFFVSPNKNFLIKFFVLCFVLFVLLFLVYIFKDYLTSVRDIFLIFEKFLLSKKGSIDDHSSSSTSMFAASDFLTILGVNATEMFGESGYLSLLLNFGIFAIVAYVLILVGVVIRLLYIIKKNKEGAGIEIYYASLFFTCAYMVGMTNLPYDRSFPMNLFFVIIALLAIHSDRVFEFYKAPKKTSLDQ